MNRIRLQTKRSRSRGAVPSPWELLYEFGRVIYLGVMATLEVSGAPGEPGMHANQVGPASAFAEFSPAEPVRHLDSEEITMRCF